MASTVLVVEDDHHVVEILRLYLGRDGHKVLSAGNGIDGLRWPWRRGLTWWSWT